MAEEQPPEWLDDDGPGTNVVRLKQHPTEDEPMRGLQVLPKIALMGMDRILAASKEPIDYVWQDIAVAGTVVLLAGPPSEGKTTLLFLVLAARMASGPVKLLDRMMVPAPKRIVVIEGEHSEASTARKIVKMNTVLKVENEGLKKLVIVARKAVTLGSPAWLEVVEMIRHGLVSDVAVDTLARVAPADANDEREQVAIFDILAQAIEAGPPKDKPMMWAVAHTRKGAQLDELEDVSGSVQRVGQADTVLLVKGTKVEGQTVSSKVIFAKLREDPDDYPKPFEFAIKRRPDGTYGIDDEAPPKDTRPLEEQVLSALKEKGRSKNALATLLKRNFSDIEIAITNLFDQRLITKGTSTYRGRQIAVFELRESNPDFNPDANPDPDGRNGNPDFHWNDHL